MRRISLVLGLLAVALMAQPPSPWVYRDHPNWDRSWNDRPMPRSGACFFKDQGYRGDRFCVNKGDRLPALPGSFGDNISSMQLFGGARATVFNDRDFRGGKADFSRSISDLSRERFRDGHTWNDRISSIMVR